MRKNIAPYGGKRRLLLIPTAAMLMIFIAGVIYFNWQDLIAPVNTSKKVEAIEDQKGKNSVLTGEELSRVMAAF